MNKKDCFYERPQNRFYDEFCWDGKYGIKDKIGKIIVEAVFDDISINEGDGYVIFTLDGKRAILPLSQILQL